MAYQEIKTVVEKTHLDLHVEQRFLQPTWDFLLKGHGGFMRSPLFPVVVFVTFYIICNVPFIAMDLISLKYDLFKRYKIQKDIKVTPALLWKGFYLNMFNNVVYVLPAGILQWIYRPPNPLPDEAPLISDVLFGVIGNIVLFDFQYYWWHRIHHSNRLLYRYIHKIHHEYTSPFSLVTQCLSPVELFTVGGIACINPIILNQHLITATFSTMLNILLSVEVHSGYEFPWSINCWIPFDIYAGPPKHDMHHKQPLTHFEPFFSHWDILFGTSSELKHSDAGSKSLKKAKRKKE